MTIFSFCPQCKSDSFLNPSIKIFISPCYHKLCELCLARIFNQGTGECPECKRILRKSNFISQTFEDIMVERECQLRKKLQIIYADEFEKLDEINKNKCIENEELEELDNFLEYYEDLVVELLESKDNLIKRLKDLKENKKRLKFSNKISENKLSENKLSENKICEKDLIKFVPECYLKEFKVGGFLKETLFEKCLKSLEIFDI